MEILHFTIQQQRDWVYKDNAQEMSFHCIWYFDIVVAVESGNAEEAMN